MTTPNYSLISQKKWREFLLTIPEGTTQFPVVFKTLGDMKSFKSTAYEINSDGVGEYTFSLAMNKEDLYCAVTAKKRNQL